MLSPDRYSWSIVRCVLLCISQGSSAEKGYAWKEFFSAFKSNFKSAIIIWLIILGLYLVTGMDCYILYTSLETMDHALFLLLMIMIVIALITIWGIYVFPYLARFRKYYEK